MELSRMGLKHAIGVEKVRAAVDADGGMTIYAAHLLPHLSSFIPSILDSGIRLLELSHTSIIMERRPPRVRLQDGGRYSAFLESETISVAEVAARTREVRDVLGDAYLQVTVPGTFNHVGPTTFTDEDAYELSAAGADGLHVHLPSVEEVGRVTAFAHKYGMLVEAYIFEFVAPTEPFSYMGVPAESPSEARRVAQQLQDVGVDIIGLMFSSDPKYYATAGSPDVLPRAVADKIRAIADSINVPMSVEGQITQGNAPQLKDLGVSILVLGSEFDDGIEGAIRNVAAGYGVKPRKKTIDAGPGESPSIEMPESIDRLRTQRSRPLRRPGVWGQAPGSVTRR